MKKACPSCGEPLTEDATYCYSCGKTFPQESNPYQASEAVIDAAPLVPQTPDEPAEYNLRFGVSASISEAFNAWFNSLGQLVLITLIPLIPGLVMLLIAIGVTVSILVKKFPAVIDNFSMDSLGDMFGSLGVGVAVMVVLFFLLAMVCNIPAFMGQFRILDERTRLGEQQTGIWETYFRGFKFVLPLFGFVLLAYVAILVLILPAALFSSLPVAIVIYVLAILVVISFVMVRLSLVLPIMVIEDLPLFQALARSNEMVMGKTWTVMGIYGVFFAVMMGIGIGMGIVGMIPVLGQLATLAAQLVLTPLQVSLMFVVYAGIKGSGPSV